MFFWAWDLGCVSPFPCYSLFFPVVFWLYEGLPDVKLKGKAVI